MNRKRVIVIGGFAVQGGAQNAGGVITATKTLMESSFSKKLDVLPIDTTAMMNESFGYRVSKASIRLLRLLYLLIVYRPAAMFTWAAGGLSLYEKLLYCLISRMFFCRSVIMFVDSLWMDRILANSFNRFIHKLFFSIPSRIVCRSVSWVDMYAKIGIPVKKCFIVHNWINLKKYTPQRKKGGSFHVLFVGWLTKTKGVYELLDAFAMVEKEFSNVSLEIVGSGPEFAEMQKTTKRLNVAAKVEFCGWLSPDDVIEKYGKADVLILPSYGEGFPYVIVEAMASKVPVITTPVGGISGVLEDKKTAYFVRVGDAKDLYQKMCYVYQHKSEVDMVVSNAYELATSCFDIEVASSRLVDVLIG